MVAVRGAIRVCLCERIAYGFRSLFEVVLECVLNRSGKLYVRLHFEELSVTVNPFWKAVRTKDSVTLRDCFYVLFR